MNKTTIVLFTLLLHATSLMAAPPYMATGIKIGEVTSSEAIVWVRLTETIDRVDFGGPRPVITYSDAKTGEQLEEYRYRDPAITPKVEFPDGSTVHTLEGAVPGAAGFARVLYRLDDSAQFDATTWQEVDPEADFTTQFRLKGLEPARQYHIAVEFGATPQSDLKRLAGKFRTAPAADAIQPVTFTVVTGQSYPDRDSPDGYKIYGEMQKMDPDFFVHTGDILYYDREAKTVDLAN